MSMYNHAVPIPDKLEYEPRIPMPEKLQYGDMNDCSARLPVGGIPTQNIAYKLEETPFYSVDNKYESYDDYITSIEDSKNEYLRHAVTDRNCDEPAFNDDTPAYNATKNSGKLNARYNESRGTTDYKPYHPEMYVGEQAEELPIYLSKTKKFTAAQANVIAHQMGDSSDQTINEQAWSDPEISYAKKDMLKWYGHIYNQWSWPSFINFNTQSTRFFNPAETMRRRYESYMMGDETIQTGPELRDEYARVIKPQVGYNYYLHPYGKHTIAFSDETDNKQRKMINEADPRLINIAQQDCQFENCGEDREGYNRRMDMGILMKSAAQNQATTTTLQKGTQGRNPTTKKEFDPKSRINKIVKGHTEQPEAHSKLTSAPKYQKDYTQTHFKSAAEIPAWVLGNLHGIQKAAKGQTDQCKIKREIQQSKDMYREVMAKAAAASGLKPKTDATANVSDHEQTTQLQHSLYSMAMKAADQGNLDRTRNLSQKIQNNVTYDDTQHTKLYCMKAPSRIQLYGKSEIGESTFDLQDGLEQRDQNWTRHG